MSDLAMTATGMEKTSKPVRRRLRRLLLAVLLVTTTLAGFGSGYLGYWSPQTLLGFGGQAVPSRDVAILDFPPMNVTLPGERPRQLYLVLKLEVPRGQQALVEAQIPRLRNSFNIFLTGIAPAAFERRGILDVVHDELSNRARLVLGGMVPVDALIQEFALK